MNATNQKETAPRQLLGRWREYLSTPVDGASLAAFRIIFGVMMLADVIRYYAYDWVGALFIAPEFHFTYPFFGFVKPWPGDLMYVHFFLMGVFAVLIVLGLFYRAATVLFFLSFSYVFFLDAAYYLNHFYLIILLSFILIVVPADSVASLDKLWFSSSSTSEVPFWSIFLIRAQLFIVYCFAGVAKLNSDWFQGEPVRMWLAARTDFPLLGQFFTEEWAVYFFVYGGLLFDLGVGFLLVFKRTRVAGFLSAAVFHFFNSQLFLIGVFPPLMMAATIIFAEPDWPRRVGSRLGDWIRKGSWIIYADHRGKRDRRSQKAATARRAAGLTEQKSNPHTEALGRASWAVVVFLHIYLFVQILVPLRHWLYPGSVNWTEEGHRFSWRMKLREKNAYMRMRITDGATGETWEVDRAPDLARWQSIIMLYSPDLVLQYVHHVRDILKQRGVEKPIIKVDLMVSLNGRAHQPLIDPEANLAEKEWSLGHADWIMPLRTQLR